LVRKVEDRGGLVCIRGAFGIGKGAMMSRLFSRWGARDGDALEEEEAPEGPLVSDALEFAPKKGFYRWIGYLDRGNEKSADQIQKDLVRFLVDDVGIKGLKEVPRIPDYLRLFGESRAVAGDRLALFFDGLDETNEDPGSVLHLESGPAGFRPNPGVTLVASFRPIPVVLDRLPAPDGDTVVSYELGPMKTADIRAMLYQGMSKYDKSLEPPADPQDESEYVKKVLERSEGNPQYLTLLVGLLREGKVKPGDIPSLPSSLAGLYEKILKSLEGGQGVSATCATEVLNLLALAREELDTAQVAGLLRDHLAREHGVSVFGVEEARRTLLSCSELVRSRADRDRGEVFGLGHQSVRSYLAVREASTGNVGRDRLDLLEHHVAEMATGWFKSGSTGRRGSSDAYLARHGLAHMVRCAGLTELGLGRSGTIPLLEEMFGREETRRSLEDGTAPAQWDRSGTAKFRRIGLPDERRAEARGRLNQVAREVDPLARQIACGLRFPDLLATRLLLLRICLAGPDVLGPTADDLLAAEFLGIADATERSLLEDGWVEEAAAALKDWAEARKEEAGRVLSRLWNRTRKKGKPGDVSPSARIAVRAASLRRDFEFLLAAATEKRLPRTALQAGDELFLAACGDVESGKQGSLDRLFALLGSRVRGALRIAWHWRSLKPIAVLTMRLLVNFPGDPRVMGGLKGLARTLFRALPRLDGLVWRRVLLPGIVKFVAYPVARKRWDEVAAFGRARMPIEQVCSLRSSEAPILEEVRRLLLEDLWAENTARDLDRRALDLLFGLGYVCARDPLFQIRRAFHGALLFTLLRKRPGQTMETYVRPYFIEGKPFPPARAGDAPSDPEIAAQREGGLWDMLVGQRTYIALETPVSDELLDLHERLVRRMISDKPEIYCKYHNIVGRPLHLLPALAMLEAQGPAEGAVLPRTWAILAELQRGKAASEDESALRLRILAKSLFEFLFVGAIRPGHAFEVLSRILDARAVEDGRSDGDPCSPSLETVEAFLRLESRPGGKAAEEAREAAVRAAMVIVALDGMWPEKGRAFFQKCGISGRGISRLREWANLDRSFGGQGAASRDRIVQKYGDQARIGLFVNKVLYAHPEVRRLASEILGDWMAYCATRCTGGAILSPRDARRLLRAVAVKVFAVLRGMVGGE
jgi:hypothetical protein